jgi:hypothetical protein
MLYLFVALKVPIVMLFVLIWWAVRQEPDPAEEPGDGGQRRMQRPHPPPRLPHAPRRGPHGDDALLPAPPRVRPPVAARARELER